MDGVSISGMTGLGTQTAAAGTVNSTSANSTDGRTAAVRTVTQPGGLQGTANISSPAGGAADVQPQVRTTEPAKAPDAAAAQAAETAREAMTGRDIIATDTDGDTLAVTKTADTADGNVTKTRDTGTDDTARTENLTAQRDAAAEARQAAVEREQAQNAAEQKAAEAIRQQNEKDAAAERADAAKARTEERTAENVQGKITTFTGITDQQLQADYLEGKISRYDYDTEMTSREQQREAAMEETAQASKEDIELAQLGADTKRVMEAAVKATGDKGSDGMRGNERLMAAENFVTDTGAQAAAASGQAKTVINSETSAVTAEQNAAKQSTDSLLRGEERIQWQFQ
ncbi:MAG: hypothetical protein VZQ80_04570 [Lachnospiraceae bacterium]|nr:hypothetical protein [Lachnospiraceae bacterium]